MIDYEEVVEAIWRYDCPRIDIDEDITTLYADGISAEKGNKKHGKSVENYNRRIYERLCL